MSKYGGKYENRAASGRTARICIMAAPAKLLARDQRGIRGGRFSFAFLSPRSGQLRFTSEAGLGLD